VARAAGVSIKTVSRVLNNEPYVREEKRRRVQEAIERLNYRPNLAARTLSATKSYLLGFLAPTGARFYVDTQLRGVLTTCQKAEHHLVVEFYDTFDSELTEKVRAVCTRTPLDGVVLGPGVCDSPAVIALLDELGVAHVAISPREPLNRDYVYMDDVQAAHDLTCHLLALGHRDIAFVGHGRGWAFTERRLQGFRLAMGYAGIPVRPEFVCESTGFTFRAGQECADALLSLRIRPTAVFAVNDEMAIGAMAAAARQGLSIPRDLSVAGFDDSPVATMTWPQLTTVRQPIEAMAAAAAEHLLRRPKELEGTPTSILLPFEIVVRESTGQPG